MPSFRPILLVGLLLATTSLSHAGIYLRASGLYTKPGDLSVDNVGAFKASLKNNVGVSGALGYKMSLFRVEAELQHLRNSVEADASSGTLAGGLSENVGTIKTISGFANGYLDFPSFFGLAPYLGAGLGYARVDLDGLARLNNGRPVFEFSGRDSVFGYQGMAGVQLHIFGQATVNAGFRLMKREDVGVRDVVANAARSLSGGTTRVFEIGVALGF